MRIGDCSSDVCSSDLVGHRREANEARLGRAAARAAGAGRDQRVRVREGLNEPPPETLLLLDGKERCVCKLTGRGWECPWGRNKGGGIRRRRVPGDIRLDGLPATPGPSGGAEAYNRTSTLVRRRSEARRAGKECVRPCRSRLSPYK